MAEVQSCCPGTQLISVGDRESDIYELLAEADAYPTGPKLLIRAERSRKRKTEQVLLWDKLRSEPRAGYQEVSVPRKGARPARVAKLEVRYAPVKLDPPGGQKGPVVSAWAVYAREVEYAPAVTAPLEWMLITTVEVVRFDQAIERLTWYSRRFGIEVYHRILKSGCRIEDRRLDSADRLEACLAIDMVIAWRLHWLTQQGRETPDISCAEYLREEEWHALCAYVKQERPPDRPPSLREAVRMIAGLGGFLGRKCDGEPGTTTLWRGWQRLQAITIGFVLGRTLYSARDGH